MILETIKKKIRPSAAEHRRLRSEVDGFVKKLNVRIKALKIKAVAIPGGSFAKGTYLKRDYDVDVFVKFDRSYKEISKLLGRIVEPFKADLVHGSRDYYQIRNKISFEIVPVLDAKNAKQALNVTDMSPMHVDWVKGFIEKQPELADEIRLVKQFCKANDVYGAESYICGFSGHVLDILIIYYNGFLNLLNASQKWKEKKVIDFYNYYQGQALKKLNKAKIYSPLIVIDPILPDRNAAAALSREKFLLFMDACQRFLKRPSKKFFERERITAASLRRKYKGKELLLKVEPLDGKVDIVGSKLLKAFEYIKKKLVEFKLKDAGWHWDKRGKALFWFVLSKQKLNKRQIIHGPPLKQPYHVRKFREKHSETFVKNKRIYARADREFCSAKALIEYLKDSDYIREKTNSISF